MKCFSFPAWCKFGKCDSGDTLVTMGLSDEDGDRLIQYGCDKTIYYAGFKNCEQLSDLYEKVLNEADDQITWELIEEDIIEQGQSASDVYEIDVDFPTEFEKELK